MEQNRRSKRRVTVDLPFSDETIAAGVAGVFTRSAAFWQVAEDPAGQPIALVPCERKALALLGRYLEAARRGLRRAADRGLEGDDARAFASIGVVQLGLVMVWGDGDEPLTPRKRLPRFPQIGATLGLLERILETACAVEGCRWPASGELTRRASERPVCCKDHEPEHGALIRRRVRGLLASTCGIVDRGLAHSRIQP